MDVEEAPLRVDAEAAPGAGGDVLQAGAEGGVDVGRGEARVVVDGVPRDAVVAGVLAHHVHVLVDLEAGARLVVLAAA